MKSKFPINQKKSSGHPDIRLKKNQSLKLSMQQDNILKYLSEITKKSKYNKINLRDSKYFPTETSKKHNPEGKYLLN
jgi:hypothetical protein